MSGPLAPRVAPSQGERGFTLIEIIAVVLILGAALMLVPANIDGFGARNRLNSAASSVVSALTGAREQAIIDGHDVILEYDLDHARFRYGLSHKTHVSPEALEDEAERRSEEPDPEGEDQWLWTSWHDLARGIEMREYSLARGQWTKGNPGGQSLQIFFGPDGAVRPPHAVRLESKDLDAVRKEQRTVTVILNGLTALPEAIDGEAEMPPRRDGSDFR